MIETNKFVRKPFHVDAVQVTEENMSDVAQWCEGQIQESEKTKDGSSATFIKVWVHRPMTERQTRAFVGDWILYARSGFKVYTTKAFEKTFEQVGTETMMHITSDTLYRDAGTGEYVTKEYAVEHPDSTVGETES